MQKYRKYDHILTGIAAGIVIPFVAYGILLTLAELLERTAYFSFIQPRTLLLIALCANIAPMQFFKKKHMTDAMRGIIFPFLLLAGWWFFTFKHQFGL